AQSGPVR
nr:56 kda actin-sequestering protein, ASP-56=peptide T3 [swine, platelets, Peptide Partial, 7 aa] [Sus scrofa]